jgi:hypothetical protein
MSGRAGETRDWAGTWEDTSRESRIFIGNDRFCHRREVYCACMREAERHTTINSRRSEPDDQPQIREVIQPSSTAWSDIPVTSIGQRKRPLRVEQTFGSRSREPQVNLATPNKETHRQEARKPGREVLRVRRAGGQSKVKDRETIDSTLAPSQNAGSKASNRLIEGRQAIEGLSIGGNDTMSHSNCKLCGSSAISTDEVDHTGAGRGDSLLLAECQRCENRWTRPIFRAGLGRSQARIGRVRSDISAEVASAA